VEADELPSLIEELDRFMTTGNPAGSITESELYHHRTRRQ
jgi:hypothetical protein